MFGDEPDDEEELYVLPEPERLYVTDQLPEGGEGKKAGLVIPLAALIVGGTALLKAYHVIGKPETGNSGTIVPVPVAVPNPEFLGVWKTQDLRLQGSSGFAWSTGLGDGFTNGARLQAFAVSVKKAIRFLGLRLIYDIPMLSTSSSRVFQVALTKLSNGTTYTLPATLQAAVPTTSFARSIDTGLVAVSSLVAGLDVISPGDILTLSETYTIAAGVNQQNYISLELYGSP